MNKPWCFAVVLLIPGCSAPIKSYDWCEFNEDDSYVEFTPDSELRETLLDLLKPTVGAEPRTPNLWKMKHESEVIACEGEPAFGCGATIDRFIKQESGCKYDTSQFIQCHSKPKQALQRGL